MGSRFEKTSPLTGKVFTKREKTLDRKVLLGGTLFGLGWGLSEVCPGSGYASPGLGNYKIIAAFAGMFTGAYLQATLREREII
ncbi:MAG: DUF6691 family protein [Candidatus Nanohalobium sp.]